MTTGFLPLNPGYKVDKMGLQKHQKRRWVIKKAMSGYVTTFGTTMLHQLMFIFLESNVVGCQISFFQVGEAMYITFVEKMVSLIIFSGPAFRREAQSCKAGREKEPPFGPLFSSPYRGI